MARVSPVKLEDVLSLESLAASGYSMFRKISVVITTTSASAAFTSTSPVFRPTRRTPNLAWNSRSFWLLSAFKGVV